MGERCLFIGYQQTEEKSWHQWPHSPQVPILLPTMLFLGTEVTRSAVHGSSWNKTIPGLSIICVFRRRKPLSHLWSQDITWASRMHPAGGLRPEHSVLLEGFQSSLPLNYLPLSHMNRLTPVLLFSSLRAWLSQAELSQLLHEGSNLYPLSWLYPKNKPCRC